MLITNVPVSASGEEVGVKDEDGGEIVPGRLDEAAVDLDKISWLDALVGFGDLFSNQEDCLEFMLPVRDG